MSYGCRIWDVQGGLILDTNDYTARIVYIDTKPGNAQGSTYLSAADGAKPLVLVVPAYESGPCLRVSITSDGWLSWQPAKKDRWEWTGNGWVVYPGSIIISIPTLIMVCVCDEKAW